MARLKKVITTQRNGHLQTWTSLKKACEELSFPYGTLSKLKFPFTYKGTEFKKTELN